ncbi:MAG: class I SAM-dependent methyltransferase [Halanaeroarchaeum sp.]
MSEDAIYHEHLEVFLLWAARETGVFEALFEGPQSAPALAASAGITERAAEVTLAALHEWGYVADTADGYEPTDALDGFRPDVDVLEQGVLPHRLDSLEHYMELPRLMRTGESPEHTESGLRHYMGAMATIDEATVRQIVTVAEHAHPRPDRVLDVGGGPGRFTAEWRDRGADVTTVDLPPVVDVLGDHYDERGFEVRVGDATEDLPTGFDMVFSARMIPSFSPTDLQAYFENAFDALLPGGTFMCTERVWDRSESARRFGFHMLTVGDADHRYTAAEYEAALADAGFVDTDVPEVPGTPFQGIVGHKPE